MKKKQYSSKCSRWYCNVTKFPATFKFSYFYMANLLKFTWALFPILFPYNHIMVTMTLQMWRKACGINSRHLITLDRSPYHCTIALKSMRSLFSVIIMTCRWGPFQKLIFLSIYDLINISGANKWMVSTLKP